MKSKLKLNLGGIQILGRALMLPIAMLPIAAILLRLGQSDLLDLSYIADAGSIIFTNLPLLFALGVATGIAYDNSGVATLASCVGYLLMTTVYSAINSKINTGVLGGILIGIVAANLYNRFYAIKLPEFLAFFGGKRFIPIVTGVAATIIGVVLGYLWPFIQNAIDLIGIWMLQAGALGAFVYGVLNRLLLVTGLHHILNNLVWFVFGSYTTSTGKVVYGTIARFLAGDRQAGLLMSGFFPIMMFGLPSACLAMYKNVNAENKKAVAGILVSMAFTSLLTGITEPIEFSFLFLAPILFVIHALLTGLSLAIMYLLQVNLAFVFSSGAIDYILFFKLATKPLYLLPVGLLFAIIYYLLFDFFIRKFNLMTIGRDSQTDKITGVIEQKQKDELQAVAFIEALGGAKNIVNVTACMTRMRVRVLEGKLVNKAQLKKLGSQGVVKLDDNNMQIVLGMNADLIVTEINKILQINIISGDETRKVEFASRKNTKDEFYLAEICYEAIVDDIVDALGGRKNIKTCALVALNRLTIEIKDTTKLRQETFYRIQQPYKVYIIDVKPTIKQVYLDEKLDAKIILQEIDERCRNT